MTARTTEQAKRTLFLIDEKPYVFWGRISETARGYLRGIDAGYWEYQALTHAERIDSGDESAQRAATALRVAYSQGVETLMALLCALAQAPWFAVGWMSRYQNADLRSVVHKIHNKTPFPNVFGAKVSWELLSEVVHAFVPEPAKGDAQIVTGFAETWRSLADQFLQPHFEPKYNSLKHGMRAGVGPFAFSIRTAGRDVEGSAVLVGRAEFGSTFRKSRKIPRTSGTSRSFEFFEETSRRWSPGQFVTELQLIGLSIGNIVSRLRTQHGERAAGLPFLAPSNPEAFERARAVMMTDRRGSDG
jgi:hypothetical protein